MKKIIFVSLFIFTLSLILLGVSFQDKKSNMTVDSLTSWRITKIDEKTYKFVGAGSPFLAFWKSQALRIKANNIDGILTHQEAGALELQKALVKGNSELKFIGTETESSRTATLNCPQLDYDLKKSHITVSGPFNLVSKSTQEIRHLTITGSQAVLTLSKIQKKQDHPIKSGTVQGPVTIKIETLSPNQNSKASKQKIVHLDALANQLDFDFEQSTLKLTGSVQIKGNDNSIYGEIEAEHATLLLDDKYDIIQMDFEGNSGKTKGTTRGKSN